MRAWPTAASLATAANLAIATTVAAADEIRHTHYDGVTNDLLTAGLGKTGLGRAAAPGIADPLRPTAEELRRLAVYNNYRALIDPTPGGGYGSLYGPNVTADGTATDTEGLIAGDEYITFEADQNGRRKVTMMVQVPDTFDPGNACIVAAPSSGSRGVYGAIATAGEWGLKRGCAVAYTDKGTGTGVHDLQNNTVSLIRGERADVAAGADANFITPVSNSERAAFNAASPNRFAFKHAHSELNPERDWGRNVLHSIRFAFVTLNRKFATRGVEISKPNTIVIASSISNGGGASLRAVEQDDEHLIDGVAVGEPNVNPRIGPAFSIVQAGRPPLATHSRPLMDYITLVNVFQGCANLAPANATAPLNQAGSPKRCADLKAKGLLTAMTLDEQATEAQKVINDYGILPEQNLVQPGYWHFFVPQSIAVTYANAYGRFGVRDNLCGYSFAANGGLAGGRPVALAEPAAAQIFATSTGIPPTAGIALINNVAPGGPGEDRGSTPNQNLDGALCLRSLATGKDAATNGRLSGMVAGQARRVAGGVEDILATGNLRGIPAVIVNGRNDGILPPNFTSRAYFGLNSVIEGTRSNLRYYEVSNAHHLDTLNQVPGYDAAYVPLHRYFIQAMDLMYDHLRHGRPLPPSQVVQTRPRGAGAPPLTAANVPPIAQAPPAATLITFADGQVNIPE